MGVPISCQIFCFYIFLSCCFPYNRYKWYINTINKYFCFSCSCIFCLNLLMFDIYMIVYVRMKIYIQKPFFFCQCEIQIVELILFLLSANSAENKFKTNNTIFIKFALFIIGFTNLIRRYLEMFLGHLNMNNFVTEGIIYLYFYIFVQNLHNIPRNCLQWNFVTIE